MKRSFTVCILFASSGRTKIWSGSFDGVQRFKSGKLGSWLARSVTSFVLFIWPSESAKDIFFFFFSSNDWADFVGEFMTFYCVWMAYLFLFDSFDLCQRNVTENKLAADTNREKPSRSFIKWHSVSLGHTADLSRHQESESTNSVRAQYAFEFTVSVFEYAFKVTWLYCWGKSRKTDSPGHLLWEIFVDLMLQRTWTCQTSCFFYFYKYIYIVHTGVVFYTTSVLMVVFRRSMRHSS